jgi:arginine decarboxylase
MIPNKIFFTKGVGVHKDKLASFEAALRDAQIEKYNLVYVSSIYPQGCKTITVKDGVKFLTPGEIVFCVMARSETNEPNRLISASIGVALPQDETRYGYLSEHHTYGETGKHSGEYAEDLAATMLATTMGIEFDADENWDSRKEVYRASGHIFKTRHIVQSGEGHKDGLWTTVLAAAVMIQDN